MINFNISFWIWGKIKNLQQNKKYQTVYKGIKTFKRAPRLGFFFKRRRTIRKDKRSNNERGSYNNTDTRQ